MDSHKETIPKEEINKVLEENPVTKEVPLIDGIPGESEEEKKDRISKLRTEIYENHKKTLNDKYTEAKEIIQKDTNKRITEAEEDYQKNVEVHKSDLEEALEGCDDSDDRRYARKNHKESIKEEAESLKDQKEQILEEHDDGLDRLKEERDENLEDITEKYESDIDDIKEGYFEERDLKACIKEFEAATIKFDTLDDYDTYGEEDEESRFDTSSLNATSSAFDSEPSFNIFNIFIKAIPVGVMVMVGVFMMNSIKDVVDEPTMNISENVTSSISIIGNHLNISLILLLTPLMIVIIIYLMGGFRRNNIF